ncbi:MAG: ATP-binding protein [Desulfamplus sp.]|nr:ATP-binding protein [Desulfamplus sp.]
MMSKTDRELFDIHEKDDGLSIIFASTMENVDRTCYEAGRFLKSVVEGISAHLFSIQLVMREGLTNAVRHGNRMDAKKQVIFSIKIKQGEFIRMEIEDQGQGFNWQMEQQRDLNDDDDHGRGLVIMKQYFSSYGYNERGNLLVLEKRI